MKIIPSTTTTTMYRVIFVFAFASTVIFVNSMEVQTCTEEFKDVTKPVRVIAANCDEPPCPLVRGTMADVNITFDIPQDTKTVTIAVTALFPNYEVNFNPPDNNVCHFLINSYCPLDADERVIYHLLLPIRKFYPKVTLTLRIRFVDDTNTTITCFEVPSYVVDPDH